MKASRPRLGLRLLWPALLVGSIIYAAGPNGSWMARQFTAPVPPWWGWFGAVLLGLAIFGGIKLATAGRRAIGIAIALVGGIVAIAVDAQYFAAAGHGLVMAALLGLFPTLLAVLAGIVEGIEVSAQESTVEADSRAERERATEAERLRLEWELREAAKDRAAARRQDRGGLRTPAAIPARQSSPVTPDRSDSAPDSDRTAPDKPNFSDQTKRAAIAYIQELAGEVTAADLADRFGVTERTGRRYLAAYRSNGHHKEPIL